MKLQKFKQTEIGMIPEEWEVKIIGDLVKINEDIINKNYSEANIEYIDTSSVDKGHLVETQKLKLEEAPSRAKRIIKDNDILISTVRPNLKHFFFVKKSKKNLIGSTGFAVISPKNINPEFLYYYLTTENYTNFLTAIADAHTSTYPSFNPDVIERSFCPYPVENEQSFIAKILSDLDSKIELNQQMNKTLEAIGQAIFKRWFVDFEFPNEKGKPYKSSGGEMVDSELGEIPKGWRVERYSDLVEVMTGKGLKREEFVENGEFPVIGANGELGRTDKFLFNEDLILTGRVGTLGTIYIIRDKVWISDNVLISKAKSKELFYYSYYILRNLDFKSLNRGSTQPLITQTDLKNQICLIPEKQLLLTFNKVLLSLYNKIWGSNLQIKNLSQIRDSILPKLMSGKIRVPVEVKT